MKQLNSHQIQIINCLADGFCHSGNALGAKCNVSRTAIWKHINQLIDLGLSIERIPQKGYRLTAPLKLLNEKTIRKKLSVCHFTDELNFHLFASLNSTNRFLKERPKSTLIDICCAETQTEGRGRFGRQWHSPFGENIYCSSRWAFNCDLSHLSGLSLVVSLAVMATLKEYDLTKDILVKWPNDLLWHHKKLCGSLIEVVAESNSCAEVIIGIGLNINSLTEKQPLPEKPWCAIREIANRYFDRNEVIAHLINHLNQYLQRFKQYGFSAFLSEWELNDYLKGQIVTVSNHSCTLTGLADGVNDKGELILIDEHQKTHFLSSGDSSLHPK